MFIFFVIYCNIIIIYIQAMYTYLIMLFAPLLYTVARHKIYYHRFETVDWVAKEIQLSQRKSEGIVFFAVLSNTKTKIG